MVRTDPYRMWEDRRHYEEMERIKREMQVYSHQFDTRNYMRITDLPNSYGDLIPYASGGEIKNKPNKKLLLL